MAMGYIAMYIMITDSTLDPSSGAVVVSGRWYHVLYCGHKLGNRYWLITGVPTRSGVQDSVDEPHAEREVLRG